MHLALICENGENMSLSTFPHTEPNLFVLELKYEALEPQNPCTAVPKMCYNLMETTTVEFEGSSCTKMRDPERTTTPQRQGK